MNTLRLRWVAPLLALGWVRILDAVPPRLYHHLAAARTVPWDRVEIFFGDERAVPPDDERSNYRVGREALLAHVPVPASAIHRMEAEQPDGERAVRRALLDAVSPTDCPACLVRDGRWLLDRAAAAQLGGQP